MSERITPDSIVITPRAVPSTDLTRLDKRVTEYEQASHADATKRTYNGAWAKFVVWAQNQGLSPLPADPSTVARYLAHRAETGRKVATLNMDRCAINHAHVSRGLESPTSHPGVVRVVRGIYRTVGAHVDKAAAVRMDELRVALDALDQRSLAGARNAALLAVGFGGALRRSELAGICVEHLDERVEGFALVLPKSKTDQERRGATIAIYRVSDERYCPVALVSRWLAMAGIKAGPVFVRVDRHGHVHPGRAITPETVNEIVKQHVAPYCRNPAMVTAHSLRAGFLTEAASAETPEHLMQQHSRHKSRDTMQGYIREGRLFNAKLGRVTDPTKR